MKSFCEDDATPIFNGTPSYMKISVIIPCHNAADYLGQTIGSLLEQTRPPDEIIVVDDRSSDGSSSVARRFGDRVLLRKVDFGQASKTRNYGAALSSGDALLFLDADDVLGPDALEGLESALGSEPEGVALIPWLRLERVAEKWVQRRASIPPSRPGQDLLAGWLTGRYYPPCCILWSRTAFQRIGGWSEEFCPNDDGDLATRALIDGIPFIHAAKGVAYYRRIPENASLSGKRFTRAGLASRLRVVEKIAAWLEERGQLHRYRYPLTYAFDEIRRDCQEGEGEFDDVRERCELLIDQFGISRSAWNRRRKARALARQSRSMRNAARRAAKKVIGKQTAPEATKEVGYGLKAFLAAAAVKPPEATEGRIAPTDPPSPTVSVIIPTYNRARLVCRAVTSVLSQTFEDFELLVVDDASQDETEKVIAEFDDPRIRYLRQPVNRDVSAARNRGLREARGKFIAFLDSDDEWLPDKLEAQVSRFRELPESVGLVYSGSVIQYGNDKEVVFTPQCRGRVFEELLLKNITDTGSASVMIRRNVIRVVGFFDEAIPAMEDYDYWIRVGRFYDFEYIERPLVRYYEVEMPDRRSLVRKADIDARRRLFRKYRSALVQAGLVHKFLLISAKRRLSRFKRPDRLGAFGLAVRAVCSKPSEGDSYRLALRSLIPGRVWNAVAGRARPMKQKRLANG